MMNIWSTGCTGALLAQKIMGRVEVYYLVEDIDLILEIMLLDINQCSVVPVILLSSVFMLVNHLCLLYTKRGITLTTMVVCHGPLDRDALGLGAKKFHIYALKFSSKQCPCFMWAFLKRISWRNTLKEFNDIVVPMQKSIALLLTMSTS